MEKEQFERRKTEFLKLAEQWREWITDYPIGSGVSFMGNPVFVWESWAFPQDGHITDEITISDELAGSITVAWFTRHAGVNKVTIRNISRAKALVSK